MSDVTEYANQALVSQQYSPLTEAEAILVERLYAEGAKRSALSWLVLDERRKAGPITRVTAAPVQAKPAAVAKVRAVSSEARKPRLATILLTDAERDLLIRAVGNLLLSGIAHVSHCRLLLEKLERSIPPK